MDFDEAAESAVEKQKFLLNRDMRREILPENADDDEEKVKPYWRCYYAKNKERIKQRLREEKANKNRPEYRAFWGLGSRVRETGNESSS